MGLLRKVLCDRIEEKIKVLFSDVSAWVGG